RLLRGRLLRGSRRLALRRRLRGRSHRATCRRGTGEPLLVALGGEGWLAGRAALDRGLSAAHGGAASPRSPPSSACGPLLVLLIAFFGGRRRASDRLWHARVREVLAEVGAHWREVLGLPQLSRGFAEAF